VTSGLASAGALVAEGRLFEALRTIGGLFAAEDSILGRNNARSPKAA
jgi:flagellar biosynthesis regulator FlbT